MGYNTEFMGQFSLDRKLENRHIEYLTAFSNTRRMKRDEDLVNKNVDSIREAVDLPIGKEGGYFVGGKGFMGQENDPSVVDYNKPPFEQPGLWCKWSPTEDGNGIEWNQHEKFYNYVEWLKYIIEHFLKPWGYVLNGKVSWRGEEFSDIGNIVVKNNIVTVQYKKF